MSWLTDSEFVKEASSGGSGGYIGRFRVDFGFKIFVSGLYEDSFFPCPLDDKKQREKARQAAEEVLSENGLSDKRPQEAVRITQYKDGVLNKEVQWSGNLYRDYPLWTDDAREIVLPSIEEHLSANQLGQDLWGRITLRDTVTDRKRRDQNGELKPEVIFYVAELYPNESAAQSAANGVTVDAGTSNFAAEVFPEWDAKTMGMTPEEVTEYIVGQLDEKLTEAMPVPVQRKTFTEISEQFGTDKDGNPNVSVEQVEAINEHRIPW